MTRPRTLALAAIAVILLTPLIAMRFTDEVRWTGRDFGVMGVLLVSFYLIFEMLAMNRGIRQYRWGMATALGASFLLIWVNLAVGIIGDEENPANLLYLIVLGVGAIGGLLARFRAPGMARTLLAMALAQGAIGLVAVLARLDARPQVLLVNVLFVGMFGGASLLFARAAR